jgi:hypothetical protein
MHIEPGLVAGTKILLSYATAAGAGGYALALAGQAVRTGGWASLGARAAVCTALTFCFFEVLPHYPVGVSEVHLILGSTLFLVSARRPLPSGWRWASSSRASPSPPSTCPSTP